MKKATLQSLYSYLNGETIHNLDEIKAELETELNKDKVRKDANAKLYDSIKPFVMDTLALGEATISELWESVKDQVEPLGATKGKVQHGVTKLWVDEIVKIEGNPNTYRKA